MSVRPSGTALATIPPANHLQIAILYGLLLVGLLCLLLILLAVLRLAKPAKPKSLVPAQF